MGTEETDRRVAGRYRLLRRLGTGGFGDVWAAEDLLVGGEVALKVLRGGGVEHAAWTRREIAALRMLRIPGIVQLLDEGMDEGRPFLVMELLDGRPFPGAVAREWSAVARPTIALLEILSRLHAEGVVHRDLKPDNVLVDEAGRPTILDFGIASMTFVPDRLTAEGQQLGTPAYLAPEQLMGERPTAAADLYAVGVMLFEALTGRLPHTAYSFPDLVAQRLTQPAPRVASLAPSLPADVAETIDWLLHREPDQRPRSAADVLRALRREPHADEQLPFLGRAELVAQVVSALEAGRSVRIAGGSGMGKTRTAEEVARLLGERGRLVSWLRPGQGALSALVPLVGSLEGSRADRVSEVSRLVEARLEAVLEAGAILVVDDAARLDRSSARILARAAERWPVLLVGAVREPGTAMEAHDLGPLSVRDLEDGLFVGSDRLFHVREDGARELHRRTNGVPARIAAETRAWIRAGLARRVGDRFALERSAIERLTSDLVPYALDALRPSSSARLPEHLDELLAWIELSDGSADGEMLAELTGQAVWEIDAGLEELVDTGICARASSARLVALEGSRVLGAWSVTARRAAHARLADVLRGGTSVRLRHLVLARTEHGVILESLRLGEHWAREGMLGRAAVALAEGFAVARAAETAPLEEIGRLLRLWVAVAVVDASTHASDRVLYELGRAPRLPDLEAMAALTRAALAVRASSTGAADLAEAVPPFTDARLDRIRQATRVLAARRRAVEEEERVVAELKAWAADRPGDVLATGSLAGWEGKLRYRQGRYREAIDLHLRAAESAEWRSERTGALLGAASAALENLDVARALELAETARTEAAASRHPYLECRADWLVRSVHYRLGRTLTPDIELVELAARVARDLEAMCATCEAAVAYRFGPRDVAASLARRAYQIWSSVGEPNALLLSGSLALACGAALDRDAVAWLIEHSRSCPVPGVGIQASALLGEAGFGAPTTDRIEGLCATILPDRWSQRLDILSVDDARGLLAKASSS